MEVHEFSTAMRFGQPVVVEVRTDPYPDPEPEVEAPPVNDVATTWTPLAGEDLLLYTLDPDFAYSLGINWPQCRHCAEPMRTVGEDWNGRDKVVCLTCAGVLELEGR